MRQPRGPRPMPARPSARGQSGHGGTPALHPAAQGPSPTAAPASPAIPAAAASTPTEPPSSGPFGLWAPEELRALPRFPHADSFPRARSLIDYFLRENLGYRDLRIALFWLGFALLEVPTFDEPTLHLVPLCKDLDTYEDTATELGYDPRASVHAGPVCSRGTGSTGPPTAASSSSSSSSYSSSSSSAASGRGLGALGGQGAAQLVHGMHGSQGMQGGPGRQGWQGARSLLALPLAARARGSREGSSARGADDPPRPHGDILRAVWPEEGYPGGPYGPDGPDADAVQCLAYKVKLLHAGGWSSSSGSEGNRTPPTPPASSSTGATRQTGGLDASHVEQFTVSFVSDLQLHEDLEETSCLCAFCLDDMKIGEELCRLPCMHTFHRRCVHAWLARDRRCMLCRLDVTRPCG